MSRRKKPIKTDQSKVRVWKEPLTGSTVSLRSATEEDNKSSRLVRRPMVVRDDASLDQGSAQNNNNISPNDSSQEEETPFSKILQKQQSVAEHNIIDKYDNQFINQSQASRPFFSFITDDIIWKATAIGCILGAVLFYFNTFQPLMLSKYIDSAQLNINNMVLETNTLFSDTAASLSALQTASTYNPTQVCTQSPDYTTSTQDIQTIDSLLATLVASKNYQSIPTAYVYYDESIDELYSKVYSTYQKAFVDAQEQLIEYKGIPRWLDYKNDWLQICKTLLSNQGPEDVQEYCDEMDSINNGYENALKPNFWLDFEPLIDDMNALCNQSVNIRDTTQWELDWIANFSIMMSFTFENNSIVDSLQIAAQTVQKEAQNTIINMNSHYNKRISIINIWYFLSIRFD